MGFARRSDVAGQTVGNDHMIRKGVRMDAFLFEYSRRDLNLRLLPSEGSTLSTELRERLDTMITKMPISAEA